MFVIAGLQPKTVTVDKTARRCPRCGLTQAYLQRIDHYVSLFFIPLLRVKKGDPFLFCERCRMPGPPSQASWDETSDRPTVRHNSSRTREGQAPQRDGDGQTVCRQCGQRLQKAFKYCPHCGQRQF